MNRARIAHADRVRNSDLKPLLINGLRHCKTCREPMGALKVLRCAECKRRHREARTAITLRASGDVAAAIRHGLLLRPSVHRCVDCNKQAECYDHRDYTQPLLVDPVCRSCNVMRGDADVWPLPKRAESATADAQG